jgi:hypothetical protein
MDEVNKEQQKQSAASNRAWWLPRKQSLTHRTDTISRSLTNIPVPRSFVPPEVTRIPTPPMFDAHGEVKGKLADFFFEHGASIAGGRKPKSTPGGYWDSDALLMSLTTDFDPKPSDEEDEGPEGPLTPADAAPRSFTVDQNPSYGTPVGLVQSPGGYLGVKSLHNNVRTPSDLQETPTPETPEHWFRVEQVQTPDESMLTAVAMREEAERRRFEWIVAEHLDNSPLCPLHQKYRGPYQGMCYWHRKKVVKNNNEEPKGEKEKREDGYGRAGAFAKYEKAESEKRPRLRRGSRSWDVGRSDAVREAKKRRLVSLTGDSISP